MDYEIMLKNLEEKKSELETQKSKVESEIDNSDSALAQMLIEGITMGVTVMSAKISSYKKNADRKTLKLAQKFLEFQEEEIEKLKAFM